MSAGKAAILIGLGAVGLVVAFDPTVFAGVGSLWKAGKGLATNPAALKNVAAGKAPDDPTQSLGDWLATQAGDSIISGLTGNGPLQVTQGGNADMPPACSAAYKRCATQCGTTVGSGQNNQCVNACVSGLPGDPCNLHSGSGGPFAAYFGVHPAGAGSVIYHA